MTLKWPRVLTPPTHTHISANTTNLSWFSYKLIWYPIWRRSFSAKLHIPLWNLGRLLKNGSQALPWHVMSESWSFLWRNAHKYFLDNYCIYYLRRTLRGRGREYAVAVEKMYLKFLSCTVSLYCILYINNHPMVNFRFDFPYRISAY